MEVKGDGWEKLRVYGVEDRITLGGILLKNGYAVRMTKGSVPGSRASTYYVEYQDNPGGLQISKEK